MYALPVTPAVHALLDERRVFDNVHSADRRWRLGERLLVNPGFAIEPYSQIEQGHSLPKAFGAFSYAKSDLSLHASIGRYCSIGASLFWLGGAHPTDWATSSPAAYDDQPKIALRRFFEDREAIPQPKAWIDPRPAAVEIGHDVWIGDAVTIAPGVSIGHGAVIGACSLVLKDVPPYAVVAGSPASILRFRFDEALVARLLALEWWRYAPDVLQAAGLDNPQRFVDELPHAIERLEAKPFEPEALSFDDLVAAIRSDS